MSRQLDLPEVVHVRNGFRASQGFVLLSVDYCQIELRILAHFSGDRDLCAAFHAQVDVFKVIAAKWLKKASQDDVSDVERHQVKQICYALIYGAGPALVAEQAHVTVETALAMMQDFLRAYPGVQKFLLHTKKQCRELGYVETLLGRRRYLPDINLPASTASHAEEGIASSVHVNKSSLVSARHVPAPPAPLAVADVQKARQELRKRKSKAERQAVNTLCQGSAADLIKVRKVFANFCAVDLLV
jgi:DNA polymerase theta